MAKLYRLTQYYSNARTLRAAIAETAPSWELHPVTIHWRGVRLTIENKYGHCPQCGNALWNQPHETTPCNHCTLTPELGIL